MIELNEKSSDLTKSSKIFNKQALNKKASSENTISKKNSNREANKLISDEKQILMSIIRSAEEKYKNRQTSIKYRKNLGITAEAVNPDNVDEEKRNILHRACLQIKLSIIQELEHQLTPQYVQRIDKFGNTPLILACKLPLKGYNYERSEILKILIKAGADIQSTEPINGWTALHWCCFNGDILSAKTLIKSGANFFLPCKKGYFPIDLAGTKLNNEIVKYLIYILIKFLEKIGNYELLNIEEKNREIKIIKKKSKNIIFDNINKKENSENKDDDSKEKNNNNILEEKEIDLSGLSNITQTVYLRLYTEHCLYWASYYNYNDEVINKFLFKFYAHPAFPIYCLNYQTALHGSCIQGNRIPFINLLKQYNKKKEIRENLYGKSKRLIPIYMESSSSNKIYKISFPVKYQEFKKKFEDSIHFNSLNKKFKNYILKHFFELIYPKSYIEYLSFEKILDKEGNTPIILAAKYSQYDFLNFIFEKNIIKNVDELLNLDNKTGYAGYYYLKNKLFKINLIKKNKKKIYPLPLVVLDVNNNESTKSSINLNFYQIK